MGIIVFGFVLILLGGVTIGLGVSDYHSSKFHEAYVSKLDEATVIYEKAIQAYEEAKAYRDRVK